MIRLRLRLLLSLSLSVMFLAGASLRFSSINLHDGAVGLNHVAIPWFFVVITSLMLGGALFLLLQWASFCISRSHAPSSGGVELFLAGAVPMAAALYFLYQLLAGALFATTSVSIDAVRDTVQTDSAIVTLKIERGDNWLTEIASAAVTTESPSHDAKRWQEADLPRRPDRQVRLAPKETTSTRFRLPLGKNAKDIVVTARVVAYGLFWPIPSESFASALVLAPNAACDKP